MIYLITIEEVILYRTDIVTPSKRFHEVQKLLIQEKSERSILRQLTYHRQFCAMLERDRVDCHPLLLARSGVGTFWYSRFYWHFCTIVTLNKVNIVSNLLWSNAAQQFKHDLMILDFIRRWVTIPLFLLRLFGLLRSLSRFFHHIFVDNLRFLLLPLLLLWFFDYWRWG